MYNELLTLNDGTTVNVSSGISDGFLWLWFSGYTMQEISIIFLDENKTSHFTIKSDEKISEYDGFTDCRLLQKNYDGNLSVCLTRGVPNG